MRAILRGDPPFDFARKLEKFYDLKQTAGVFWDNYAPGDTQGDLVDHLEASMQMMTSMSADSMVSMVPLHSQTLAAMIVRMSQDMTDIRMAGDAAWTAAVDSVRNDLTRMPELGDEELKAFMPAHQDRVMRLIRMHRAMTARIGK